MDKLETASVAWADRLFAAEKADGAVIAVAVVEERAIPRAVAAVAAVAIPILVVAAVRE
jgi:hypothetical protein